MVIKKRKIIGIAGASASGKTTLAEMIAARLKAKAGLVVCTDSYYREQGHLSFSEREQNNYDHPDAIEYELLAKDLLQWKSGQDIHVPVYDYAVRNRTKERELVDAEELLLVEGILTLWSQELKDLLDFKIFIEASEEVLFARRLSRDTKERGRSPESVQQQWSQTVWPMYQTYCLPSAQEADLRICGETFGTKEVVLILEKTGF